MARVLVVDDSTFARRKLKTILSHAGHEIVSEASNGVQAIREYERLKPDLVTMDVTMPIMDGVTAVHKIIEAFPDARIIMVSALTQRNMVLSALEGGARHYIIKQSSDEKIMEVVQSVLSDTNTVKKQNNSEVFVEKAQPVEETNSRPFSIENKNGVFIIDIENVKQENLNQLSTAVKGLVAVKPLKVVFNFGEMEYLDNDTINRLVVIMQNIKSAEGDIKVVSKSGWIIQYLKNKSNSLLSSYFSEVSDTLFE